MILEKLDTSTVDQDLETLNKLRSRPRTVDTKLLKTSSNSRTALAVTPFSVDMSASSEATRDPIGVSVIADTGTVIRGPVGFTGSPGDIRVAALWKFNDLLLSGAPSTIMTPIPTLVFAPPLESIARFAKSAAVLGGLFTVI